MRWTIIRNVIERAELYLRYGKTSCIFMSFVKCSKQYADKAWRRKGGAERRQVIQAFQHMSLEAIKEIGL
jgi:hypothetical protein